METPTKQRRGSARVGVVDYLYRTGVITWPLDGDSVPPRVDEQKDESDARWRRALTYAALEEMTVEIERLRAENRALRRRIEGERE